MSDKKPEYAVGDARAEHFGQIELKDGRIFRGAIITFPAGPPDIPFSVVWNGTPLTLAVQKR